MQQGLNVFLPLGRNATISIVQFVKSGVFSLLQLLLVNVTVFISNVGRKFMKANSFDQRDQMRSHLSDKLVKRQFHHFGGLRSEELSVVKVGTVVDQTLQSGDSEHIFKDGSDFGIFKLGLLNLDSEQV